MIGRVKGEPWSEIENFFFFFNSIIGGLNLDVFIENTKIC